MSDKTYSHTLIVQIAGIDRGSKQARDRLTRWVETYGHTASEFGFEFKRVGAVSSLIIGHATERHELDAND